MRLGVAAAGSIYYLRSNHRILGRPSRVGPEREGSVGGGSTPFAELGVGVCGIVAAVSPRGSLSEHTIRDATTRLRHRGPDAQRVWIAADRRAALGHARLSIIDPATGDQPIANEDGGIRLVVNGEFYDFERIRGELQKAGHAFRTGSDSEIALHLYEDCGAGALDTLRGEFAIAIWDARRGQLFAARDRFGIKPLYYTVHDGAFYLASEVKAFPDLGVPLRWDRETLFDTHTMFMVHAPERTLFAGVYQVPPGHYLITDGTFVRLGSYWDWNMPALAEAEPEAAATWIERLEATLSEAVRLRLRADVPVACYLSGGVDSSAVLGLAARAASTPIRAYTLSFDDPAYDEVGVAEETAKRTGAEFCRIDIRSEHLADHFADALYYAERPIINAHAVAKYLLSRAVRDSGIKVVLTGEGGDEIFAGYPEIRRDLARSLTAAGDRPANGSSAGADGNDAARQLTALDSARRALGYVPANVEVWAQFGAGLLPILKADFLSAFGAREPLQELLGGLDLERQMRGRHPVNQSLYLFGKTMLPNYILSNLGDRMEMAHSVEGRLPILDHHVAELVARMPVELKINGEVEKYALREAARPVLTDTVYRRQKHTFLAPPSTIQQNGRLYAFLQDTLRSKALDGPGLYDRAKLVPVLDRLPSMDAQWRAFADPLMTWMASLCLLGEQFGL